MPDQISYLLKKKIFLPFFLTQFFGAFNDNAYKLSILTLISYHLSTTPTQSEHYQAWAGALFILPFFLFSATAGQLADKYDKAKMARWVKSFEVLLMIVGAFALYYQTVLLMMIVLTGMGIHSSFFGPLKYAILPDLLPRPLLLNATALIESSTFLAILLGTTFGALVIGSTEAHISYAIVLTNIIAILGLLSSLFIPNTPPKIETLKIDWHVWHATRLMLKETMLNIKVLPTIFTISWFWLLGAVVLTKLPDYMHYVLNADTTVFAVFLALFSIGIAFGSIAIGYLLGGKITLKYVPLAMLLLSVFAIDLYFASPKVTSALPLQGLSIFFTQINNIRITIDFFLFSFCGGLFIVPLYTFLQVASEDDMRARVIASNNICNALFMVLGSLLVIFLLYLQLGITIIFLILAILNALVAIGLWLLLRKYFKN